MACCAGERLTDPLPTFEYVFKILGRDSCGKREREEGRR